MNLNRTTSYALKILSFMAIDKAGIFSSGYLYQHLKIPHKYLRRLLTDLTAYGFIKSSRGRNGGFVFAKRTGKITLYDIIDKVEGFDNVNVCILGMTSCLINQKQCFLHDKWCGAREKLIEILKETTLKDLNMNTL